ncbi:Alpha/Beta hydrolase protein [Coniella lustricola]|uniref:Carboxylic ester hydrolase n=1 Tax=Coniella lustricola TaxID=2025994 RepID=A0A2T3A3E8_9PEZI|nr:Alpha/Beta hydrolase protein [Coniella lustricola]
MVLTMTVSICFLSLVTHTLAFSAPNVKLPYMTLSGVYSTEYNITAYRSIPFAASTAPPYRFQPPRSPPALPASATYNTNQDFSPCPVSETVGSEDCLYLGIYSRPWLTTSTLRPVTVVFHGGAYQAGEGSFTIPPYGFPTLNVSDTNDFILVYPNYRLGALGFLPGQAIHDDPDAVLNPGLVDQYAALQWVHNYISLFGGDPSNVTIFGQSAGGGSVIAQTIAHNGAQTNTAQPKLFARAAASSPWWPRTYHYNDPEAEAVFDSFVDLTSCSSVASMQREGGQSSASSVVECLRTLNLRDLITASSNVGEQFMAPHFVWVPVIDDVFLTQPLSTTVLQHNNKHNGIDAVWGLYNSYDGSDFVDTSLALAQGSPYNATAAGFDSWLADFLPRFSAGKLQSVRELYPAVGKTDSPEWSWNTSFARAAYIYRDVSLACPAFWIASTVAKEAGTSWLAEYAVPPAEHGSDEPYICLEPGYNSSCIVR